MLLIPNHSGRYAAKPQVNVSGYGILAEYIQNPDSSLAKIARSRAVIIMTYLQ
jgi:hypothetical protein